MIRGHIIKALFAGFVNDRAKVQEHICAYPYRDATRIKTPIRGRGYTHVYVAETESDSYCVYHPEIAEEFPGGYPEWAEDIARSEGLYLDKEKGVYVEGVEIGSLGLRIWNVSYAAAMLYIKLGEIQKEQE